MGAEVELAKLFIAAAVLLTMVGFMTFNLGFFIMAFIFGGPLMIGLRWLSDEDPDYVKVYTEALQIPYMRQPE